MAKKLIEVSLPLEAINAASAREKSIRHGHPSTLHLWWARRPLAAARAVIWSSLVDDPSSHPELFPTEEDQKAERQRLFKILEKLVVWENSNNEKVLNEAKAEIMRWTNNDPPALLDPFAGGGAIPLEAQRLGLEAHAHDLNPVAVMINKAMIEIPPRFANKPPVHPTVSIGDGSEWRGAGGLAEDVRYYGEWMKQEAFARIGHLYPKVKDEHGTERTVIAWIWARTVKCPNPACGCEMPLARSFDLSKKKGNIYHIEPSFVDDHFEYSVKEGKSPIEGTVERTGATCLHCHSAVDFDYIRNEGKNGHVGADLMAVIAEGEKGRLYVSPNSLHKNTAKVDEPNSIPTTNLPEKALGFRVQLYGMNQWKDLFTNRQLTALTTFSDLVSEAQQKATQDALASGMPDDGVSLADGGSGAKAYGEAVGVYLAFVVDKMTDYNSTICAWHTSRETLANTFGRQAIPMVWDYTEANPFSNSSGCFDSMLNWETKCINTFLRDNQGIVRQFDAQSDCGLRNIMISTDPPYYDNIGYADLSDYFYVWMRQSLKNTYPKLFRTMLVPKEEELIATPYRHDGSKQKAKDFFEDGMYHACQNLYSYARNDVPVTIYYAYKQSNTDNDNAIASTGWETMISSIIRAGFAITGTWPVRTELVTALKGDVNALATSVVLVCRKRDENAPVQTRRNFVNELRRSLRPALQKLQSSNIAPVDLAQSAIGPGMGVFSKYSKVLEADGTPMTVRSALQIINQELDMYFNEQDSSLDSESRFCVDLYSQYAFNEMPFGDANTLATAKNTSVASMAAHGILFAQKGRVHLTEREELPEKINDNEKCIWLLCQQLTYKMEKAGIEGCADAIKNMFGSSAEYAKDMAYRLYTIAERKKWAQEAYAYNSLVVAWPEIQSRAAELKAAQPQQGTLWS